MLFRSGNLPSSGFLRRDVDPPPPELKGIQFVEITEPVARQLLLFLVVFIAIAGPWHLAVFIEQGRGYVPGAVRTSRGDPLEGVSRAVGSIVLDASFSPVRRVSYQVESARVEQRTDLDKLIIDIETNGAIEPEEAIRYAARILVDQQIGRAHV